MKLSFEGVSSKQWERRARVPGRQLGEGLPTIAVRNCTQVSAQAGRSSLGTRYEVNVGSQTFREGGVEWNLKLEYEGEGGPLRCALCLCSRSFHALARCASVDACCATAFERCSCRYMISSLSSEDKSWLRVDNTEGWLEKEGAMCEIPLFLSTERMGIFCAYLWIDNLANPIDRKCVRVSMEVCCPPPLPSSKLSFCLIMRSMRCVYVRGTHVCMMVQYT